MARKRDGPTPAKTVRCAIYTRKSTEEGLDQDFNSLDAQREAAEAFISSQKHEGWVALPNRYDDGGYSGATLDRPALRRLLADVEAGQVDCIVVYKVDRISRSLLDFARIMETLERQGTSFVSVTRQFNTTHSMGRLTLNVLLSFAQFERETTAERTRDKMSAARRKGKWTGGMPVLGYDVAPDGGRLVVNEDEAAQVRAIYELYLEHQALLPTVKELSRRGWTTKRWVTRAEQERGGKPLDKARLHGLLTNVIYLGKVKHKGEVYDGEHDAIVEEKTWHRVQALLRRNGRNGGKHLRNKHGALLRGLIHCTPCGAAMTHTYTLSKPGKRYRYYVCSKAQKQGWAACPTKSLPAGEIERFVVDRIRCIGQDPSLVTATLEQARAHASKSRKDLERESRALDRELKRHNAEVRRLATAGGDATDESSTATRLADLHERIRHGERRATVLREELAALKNQEVDEQDLASALSHFDPVWDALAPREQARVVRLLVERVAYDGEEGSVAVTLHPSGIKALAHEARFADEQQAS